MCGLSGPVQVQPLGQRGHRQLPLPQEGMFGASFDPIFLPHWHKQWKGPPSPPWRKNMSVRGPLPTVAEKKKWGEKEISEITSRELKALRYLGGSRSLLAHLGGNKKRGEEGEGKPFFLERLEIEADALCARDVGEKGENSG